MNGNKSILIGDRKIGVGEPCFVVAEISANHNGSYEEAEKLVRLAAECGADAVKLQTYTADTLTLNSQREEFMVRGGTLWDGMSLYDLYQKAAMPWQWQPRLAAVAKEEGIIFFSTPFDESSLIFLEEKINPPLHKIASFELVDDGLLAKIAATKKPIIMYL